MTPKDHTLVRYTLDTELTEQETYLIGLIVSQWAFIEAEIFEKTIETFADDEAIPASMKTNAYFGEVLELWKKRVVEAQSAARKAKLTAQYERILSLNEFRQAVVHSRWEWKSDAPDEITAVRFHKKSIKRVKFTFDDLANFAVTLGEIRYSIRYPGGLQDRAEELSELGGHVSRLGWELLSGRVTLDDLAKRDENE
ncbi:MAG: hypothetical protein K8F59_15340 [Rhodobacteraceae bacterium]|nr:hypothetical protein [Paracoccaceae bacterium]